MPSIFRPFGLLVVFLFAFGVRAQQNPILFVTQVPTVQDSATVVSLFGNHGGSMVDAPRGGDLYIRYPDGSVKNLTKVAGYGVDGLQGAGAIAVRQPCVDWSGTKALFSMVVGGATTQGDASKFYWQIYEITGLGKTQTPVITKIANQPDNFNNLSPIYGTNGRIIFTSDRTITGERHLYPTLDEYKCTHTNTGLWSLDPTSGDLFQMDVSPSGDFSPYLDSYGRVLVMRWDRLQRDRNADIDALGTGVKGTFDYTSEASTSTPQFGVRREVFPEPQGARTDLLTGTNMVGFEFNQFFPWMINEDGSSPETINHLGRHEMRFGVGRSITDDPNVANLAYATSGRSNQNPIANLTQLVESPVTPGLYYGIDAQQQGTHSGGQILSLTAQPTLDPNESVITYVTNRATQAPVAEGGVNANHTGFYRNPIPLSDGKLIAAHSTDIHSEKNLGTATNPVSRFNYRIKVLKFSGGYYVTDTSALTQGISKNLTYWDPNTLITYSGPLWELDPVEVRARTKPTPSAYSVGAPELAVFAAEGVSVVKFKSYLKDKNLAVAITRDVTHRDALDKQQPYFLRVAGTTKQSANATGKIYDVSHMQFYQGDFIRGNGLISQGGTPHEGRRVLATELHTGANENPDNGGGPSGSVKIASDGSLAAFLPARRPTTWSLLSPTGQHVVRERYWVTYQPGDIRTCASCHGTNDLATNKLNPVPQSEPEALHVLLKDWKSRVMPGHVSLISPGDNDSVNPHSTTLKWTKQDLATSYRVIFALDSQLNTKLLDTVVTADSLNVYFGIVGPVNYWQVQALGTYVDGGFSEKWRMRVVGDWWPDTVYAPHLISPINRTIIDTAESLFTWTGDPKTSSYRLMIANDTLFKSTFIDLSGLKDTSKLIAGLERGRTYYWGVIALSKDGSANLSEIWSFDTKKTITASVRESEHTNDISVVPNPAHGYIEVSVGDEQIVNVKIFDALGRVMIESGRRDDLSNTRLSTASLLPGSYVAIATTPHGTRSIRFVIQ